MTDVLFQNLKRNTHIFFRSREKKLSQNSLYLECFREIYTPRENDSKYYILNI